MKHPLFQPSEECYLKDSPRFPHLSGRECTIIGELASRAVYDDFGELVGYFESYKVKVDGVADPICAPESMLRKKFFVGSWAELTAKWDGKTQQIWRPRREAR